MKTVFSIAILVLAASAFTWAQQGPPPSAPPKPVEPEYSPYLWKEYSFADDGVRFRFPVEPKQEEQQTTTGGYPIHTYTRQSFMMFQLTVTRFPDTRNVEAAPDTLDRIRDSQLDVLRRKGQDPKIIKDEKISVDGHAARFLVVETNDHSLIRSKIFAIKNRLYLAGVIVTKGQLGLNSQNNFEAPAMAFLDSIHVSQPRS